MARLSGATRCPRLVDSAQLVATVLDLSSFSDFHASPVPSPRLPYRPTTSWSIGAASSAAAPPAEQPGVARPPAAQILLFGLEVSSDRQRSDRSSSSEILAMHTGQDTSRPGIRGCVRSFWICNSGFRGRYLPHPFHVLGPAFVCQLQGCRIFKNLPRKLTALYGHGARKVERLPTSPRAGSRFSTSLFRLVLVSGFVPDYRTSNQLLCSTTAASPIVPRARSGARWIG